MCVCVYVCFRYGITGSLHRHSLIISVTTPSHYFHIYSLSVILTWLLFTSTSFSFLHFFFSLSTYSTFSSPVFKHKIRHLSHPDICMFLFVCLLYIKKLLVAYSTLFSLHSSSSYLLSFPFSLPCFPSCISASFAFSCSRLRVLHINHTILIQSERRCRLSISAEREKIEGRKNINSGETDGERAPSERNRNGEYERERWVYKQRRGRKRKREMRRRCWN